MKGWNGVKIWGIPPTTQRLLDWTWTDYLTLVRALPLIHWQTERQ